MICGNLLVAAAALYGVISWLAARPPARAACAASGKTPTVTVLKPLCGAEPETYECLRSFCDQTHRDFQIVFGIADPGDRVLEIVQRLKREFPQVDVQIAVDHRQHGSSRKVSNLINMMSLAKHEYLVFADCDVRVQPDYLANVVAPLLDPSVGIVTCPYRGVSRRGAWSKLGSMFINEWFMPSVQVAALLGSRAFAFGATIALRREVLAQIGGLDELANHLADDYRLGELTRGLGLRTVLSDVEVEVIVIEDSLRKLVQHELRWLRTIRAVRPLGYGFCFVTFGLPVAMIGSSLTAGSSIASGLLAVTIAARALLHLKTRPSKFSLADLAIVPIRDFLSFGMWIWSFTTRGVRWRDRHYRVFRDGSVLPIVRT
jgi:ceramide glucosyltransferase